jgi:small acid-soluble spore protein F (minor alpha/beta-type SASP)
MSKNDRKKKADPIPDRQKLKEEIAAELGLLDDIHEKGWGSLSSRETGKIGGIVSKKLKLRGTRKK